MPGYSFQFDFPDFGGLIQRFVSKNLEAWGYELLAEFRPRSNKRRNSKGIYKTKNLQLYNKQREFVILVALRGLL